MLNEMHLPDKANARLFSNAGRLLDLAVKRAKMGGGAACIIAELREIAKNAGLHSMRANPKICCNDVVQHPSGKNSDENRDRVPLLDSTKVLVNCEGTLGVDWNLQRCVDSL